MSSMILGWSLLVAQTMLGLAMVFAGHRLVFGPSAQDRVLATDALATTGMLLLLTFGIRTGSLLYFEAALILALLGFASSSAMAKFLMRGEVIE